MGDRLTQLQDAVDQASQLARQFVACIHFLHRHHNQALLGPSDKVQEVKPEQDVIGAKLEPLPEDDFKAGQIELARDLIYKTQEIEMIISTLPGLENNEDDQNRCVRELEEELRVAEAQRLDAVREMNVVQERLDEVIRGTMRP